MTWLNQLGLFLKLTGGINSLCNISGLIMLELQALLRPLGGKQHNAPTEQDPNYSPCEEVLAGAAGVVYTWCQKTSLLASHETRPLHAFMGV